METGTGNGKKRSRETQAEGLSFLDTRGEKNVESGLKSSFTGNELEIIRGKVGSWARLVSGSSVFLKDVEDKLGGCLDSKELYRGIIISKRVTNLPIRYSNMPGSIIPNLCGELLYSVSERFPCTPLNSSFEKEGGEKVSFGNGVCFEEDVSRLEQALFGVADGLGELVGESGFLINKKRKKEVKANADYLRQKLSIFPGNVGREYLVFQRYDDGIILDGDAVMDATPEILAQHIARRLRGCTVLDACGGVGGNTIAFSQHCKRVVSVEVSSSRTLICKHNSQVYKLYGSRPFLGQEGGIGGEDGIEEIRDSGSPSLPFNRAHAIDEADKLLMYSDPGSNIVFVNGDILDFCRWYRCGSLASSPVLRQEFLGFEPFEWAFASPPWGGYSYNGVKSFSLDSSKSLDYRDMIVGISGVANNVALFLPRNTNLSEFSALFSVLGFNALEIEAIRDTRFNYILGLVLYAVRTRSKFGLRYIFGQDINLIREKIAKRLVLFVQNVFKKSVPGCDQASSQESLSRFAKKVEKWLKKRGLESVGAITNLLNYIVARGKDDQCADPSLLERLSSFVSEDGASSLARAPDCEAEPRYGRYIRRTIKRLKRCGQFSGSE